MRLGGRCAQRVDTREGRHCRRQAPATPPPVSRPPPLHGLGKANPSCLPPSIRLQACRTAHPDKGGDETLFQQLTAARDALLAGHAAAAAQSQQAQERAERRARTALDTLQRQQGKWPPERGHLLSIAAEAVPGSSCGGEGQARTVPVLGISGSEWRKVLVPTGNLLARSDTREDHWWGLPRMLLALQQRFPAADGHSLLCSADGVAVVRHAGQPSQHRSSVVSLAAIASGQVDVATVQLHPAAPAAGSGPSTPSGSSSGSSVAAAGVLQAAQRAAAIIACFESTFGSERLLQACGRQGGNLGSDVSRRLFSGALLSLRQHYGLPQQPAGDGDSDVWQAAQLMLAGRQALLDLGEELIQLLPALAAHPAGLPACLVPDVGDSRGVTSASIICCCHRFGSSADCLARFAPGVSGERNSG